MDTTRCCTGEAVECSSICTIIIIIIICIVRTAINQIAAITSATFNNKQHQESSATTPAAASSTISTQWIVHGGFGVGSPINTATIHRHRFRSGTGKCGQPKINLWGSPRANVTTEDTVARAAAAAAAIWKFEIRIWVCFIWTAYLGWHPLSWSGIRRASWLASGPERPGSATVRLLLQSRVCVWPQ